MTRSLITSVPRCVAKAQAVRGGTVGVSRKLQVNPNTGIQIERDKLNKTMFIHQEAYAFQILNRFKMSETKPMSVLADVYVCLKLTEDTI